MPGCQCTSVQNVPSFSKALDIENLIRLHPFIATIAEDIASRSNDSADIMVVM